MPDQQLAHLLQRVAWTLARIKTVIGRRFHKTLIRPAVRDQPLGQLRLQHLELSLAQLWQRGGTR